MRKFLSICALAMMFCAFLTCATSRAEAKIYIQFAPVKFVGVADVPRPAMTVENPALIFYEINGYVGLTDKAVLRNINDWRMRIEPKTFLQLSSLFDPPICKPKRDEPPNLNCRCRMRDLTFGI